MKMMIRVSGLVLSTVGLGTTLLSAAPLLAAAAPPAAPTLAVPVPGDDLKKLTGAVAAPAAEASSISGGGKIQFEMPTYDFGKSKAGEPVKYTFVFTNIGTEMLEIKNVRP